MAKDYIFGFNPTKVPESFERPDHIPEFIHGPRPNIVPSQDNKVISYYEEIIRLKRAMDALQSELEDIIRSQIPDYDSSNANNVLSVNDDGTKMEWKPATSASGVSASVEQTETGATITITDASGTTTATVDNGTDGVTPNVSATATVDNTTGTPSVQVTKSGTDEAPAFNFDFSGIKGETGKGTKGDDGFSPIANVQQTETGATITVTDKSGTTTATVENGTKGDPGVTPSITATATVDNTTGTPSVQVTKSGTDEAPAFNFAFTGIKGTDGHSIEGPAGPGVPAGGTAGQVLTKVDGTDYNTEWKDPTGDGASRYVTFGGNNDNFYVPRLEEELDKSFEDFRMNINKSTSVSYFVNGAQVDDTLNVNGVLKIPAGTPLEIIRSYFIGGNNPITSEYAPMSYKLNKSDFTITLSSGNALEVTYIAIVNIKSSQPSTQDASIEISCSVGTEPAYFGASIGLGQLAILDQQDLKTYYLETTK